MRPAKGKSHATRKKYDRNKLAYFSRNPGSWVEEEESKREREKDRAARAAWKEENEVTMLLIGSLIIKMLKTYFFPFSLPFGCLTTNKKRELFMSYVITSWSRFSAIN